MIADARVYGTRTASRRRSTKAQMDALHSALIAIVAELEPCTVRGVYYQAVVRNLVAKTESGYRRVQQALVNLRREGAIPWPWIVDQTRWMRKPASFGWALFAYRIDLRQNGGNVGGSGRWTGRNFRLG